MKILIVDDNYSRITDIKGVIDENFECDIEYCTNIIEAKRKVKDSYYEILILDIMLPLRMNEEVLPDGGIKFLHEIGEKDRYKYPGIVIGLTSDQEVIKKNKYEIFSFIHYEVECLNWKEELKNYIKLASDTIKRMKKNGEVDYNYDVGIVCALDEMELSPIRKIFDLTKKTSFSGDSSFYYEGVVKFGENKVKVVATSCEDMGLTSAAVSSMKVIENYRPKFMFMTGICAGIKGKVNYGDIIVADPIWNYCNGKYIEDNGEVKFLQAPNQIRVSVELENIVKEIAKNGELLRKIRNEFEKHKPDDELRCLVGAFASGEAVLATGKKIEDVKEQSREILGIDMESYAVHYVGRYCTKLRPEVLTLKSVCDFGDKNKDDNYQEYAAYTSARLLYEIINSLYENYM